MQNAFDFSSGLDDRRWDPKKPPGFKKRRDSLPAEGFPIWGEHPIASHDSNGQAEAMKFDESRTPTEIFVLDPRPTAPKIIRGGMKWLMGLLGAAIVILIALFVVKG